MKTRTEAYKVLIAAGWTVEEIDQAFKKESEIEPWALPLVGSPPKSPPTWVSPLHVSRSRVSRSYAYPAREFRSMESAT